MLPELHRQCYAQFRQELSSLVQQMTDVELSTTSLVAASQQLEWFFRERVSALDELTGVDAHRSQAYQVEMDKQLRLLAVDVMFLKAAKQSVKQQQRLAAVRQRLHTLIGYCDALLS